MEMRTNAMDRKKQLLEQDNHELKKIHEKQQKMIETFEKRQKKTNVKYEQAQNEVKALRSSNSTFRRCFSERHLLNHRNWAYEHPEEC